VVTLAQDIRVQPHKKIKWRLCVIHYVPCHELWQSGVSYHRSWPRHWLEVTGQLLDPVVLPHGDIAPVGPHIRFGRREEGKKDCLCRDSNPLSALRGCLCSIVPADAPGGIRHVGDACANLLMLLLRHWPIVTGNYVCTSLLSAVSVQMVRGLVSKYLVFGGGGLTQLDTSATIWPIVVAPDGWWWWVWSS
jgi:hypothetical protein